MIHTTSNNIKGVKLKVFIGSSEHNIVEQQVLLYSLFKISGSTFEYFTLDGTNRILIDQFGNKSNLPNLPLSSATKFSWARFCIPEICNYEGIAVYVDSDILVLDDILNLEKEIKTADFAAVRADEAIVNAFYKKRILQPLIISTKGYLYLSSVMVFNCTSFKDIKIIDLLQLVSNGELEYKDVMFLSERFLSRFNLSVRKIEPHWNSLDYFDPNTKIVHFTELFTQPWFSVFNPVGKVWYRYFTEAMKEGFLNQTMLENAINLKVLSRSVALMPYLHESKMIKIEFCVLRFIEYVSQLPSHSLRNLINTLRFLKAKYDPN
jgi:lipopolysaccharide biosynthesis glycosyltransferase